MKKEIKQQRCVIYTRKSTVKGIEISYNSLEAQEDICKGFIERREKDGWCHTSTYSDAGLSGKNTERPALQRMLADARDGRFDFLVVYKMDRLARNQLDFLKMLEELAGFGIEVVSVTENFDCTGPVGRAMRNLLGIFAQMEREIIRERCLERAEAARMKGLYLGGFPPFGYNKVEGKLVANHNQAALVRKAYRLYAGGMGTRQIADEMNRIGLLRTPTRKGVPAPLWTHEAVLKMLRNPVYKGYIRGAIQLYRGVHHGLVSEALWEAVQQRRYKLASKLKSRLHAIHHREYPLRGKLFCAHCGGRLLGKCNGKKAQRYYVCRTRHMKGKAVCDCPWLNADEAERCILSAWQQLPMAHTKVSEGESHQTSAWDDFSAVFTRVIYDGTASSLICEGPKIPSLNLPYFGCRYTIPEPPAPKSIPSKRAICMANALHLEKLLLSGVFHSPAALAKALHISRSLLYDRLALLNRSSAAIEAILFETRMHL